MADARPDDKLTPSQYRALAELLVQPSIRKAAEASGVKERTLYTWLKQPDFAEAYRLARREATQQAIARLQQISGHAVMVLYSLMTSSTAAVKLGAVRTVLEFAIKAVEIEDLAARLEALEKAYAAKL